MTATYLKVFLLTALLLMFNACEDDTPTSTNCDDLIEISPNRYQAGASNNYTISQVSIVENCMEITYSSSGCSGNSWEASLLDAGEVLESFPIQRRIKMILNNEEACQAIFTKTTSFDLSPIQTENYTEIMLNLDGYSEQIRYSYGNRQSVLDGIKGEWSLVNINGGLAGFDINFEVGQIVWDFLDTKVKIENNSNTEDQFSGFESGTYSYSVETSGDVESVTINDQNLGSAVIVDNELRIDQRAVDGFQYILQRR